MPGLANILTDQQLAALLAHLRSRFNDQAPWTDIARQIDAARRSGPGTVHPSHGADPARVVITQSEPPCWEAVPCLIASSTTKTKRCAL
jgi:hypothetical protein